MKILVTGAAGFIGYHTTQRLLAEGHEVVGIDNLNHYYDVNLKLARLRRLHIDPARVAARRPVRSTDPRDFVFLELDLTDSLHLRQLFAEQRFEVVVNLAAQAGVRYSLENPQAYLDSNITGFANVLECCRYFPVQHLVYASSSSVYGLNAEVPFRVGDGTDQPASLYAASKKSNELMAHTYSHLYGIPCTGLRLFTVYGEWGRPDMAVMLFADAILSGQPIQVFNHGQMRRDFTYVGDIIEGLYRVIHRPPTPTPARPVACRLYNLGKGSPVALGTFIDTLETLLGAKTTRRYLDMQAGDVRETYADVSALREEVGYCPTTDLRTGLTHFVAWYRSYYTHLFPAFIH